MNIAYLISAYIDAPHVKRMIDALSPNAHFFIHVDKNKDITPFKKLIKGDNIHFTPTRYNVRWATFSQVLYQLALLEQALNYPIHFDYLFFLSGTDYPLWSNERIETFLIQNKGKEFIQGICIDDPETGEQQRKGYSEFWPEVKLPGIGMNINKKISILLHLIFRVIGLKKSLSFRVQDKKWSLYKGGSYFCITEELAQHILDCYNKYPQIKKYFSNLFGPEEALAHTIAFNSPEFKDKCILTKGEYKGLCHLTPLHHIDYSNGIKVWTEADYDELMNSGKMFARKFLTGKSNKVIEQIDKKRYKEKL